MLGRFLEISLPADPVLPSVQFYERLGFAQLSTADLWRHHYGVISDGRFLLGLHGDRIHVPTLSWVREDVARLEQDLRAARLAVTEVQIAHDAMHELALDDPDGLGLRILEARSFSNPGHIDTTGPLGWFRELQLRVADTSVSGAFWERVGLLLGGRGQRPFPRTLLSCEGLNLKLLQDPAAPAMVAVFDHPDPDALLAELAVREMRPTSAELESGRTVAFTLQAPEGLILRVEVER